MGIFDKLLKPKHSTAASFEAGDSQARAANLKLLQAMDEIAKLDSTDTRRALYAAMEQAWFIVPTENWPAGAPSGRYISDDQTRMGMPVIVDKLGQNIVPAFTDEEALEYWSGATPWFALQGTAFFACVVKTEIDIIAINPPPPGKPLIRAGGRLTRSEFTLLAKGQFPLAERRDIKVSKGTKVLLGMPAKMPNDKIFAALGAAAHSEPSILALHYCQIQFPEGPAHGAIAIELRPGTPESQLGGITGSLFNAIQPLLAGDAVFDFFPSGFTALADSIKKTGKAIYVAPKP